MVSFILWLAVTFCTSQEGEGKKSLQQWATSASQGIAQYKQTNCSVGFPVPPQPSTHFTKSSQL